MFDLRKVNVTEIHDGPTFPACKTIQVAFEVVARFFLSLIGSASN